ncbi:MAG: CDP-glucose 4,6-dehydratase, partial [Elusimicrobia bacterium]|nr:CDP-glucose 4,6-dehydratase [Elusimicrobiota bacterium]
MKPAPFGGAFAGRRVLVTGHTGFKGAWLCLWLEALGARVSGYALAPDTEPSLFAQSGLAARVDSELGDVRDAARLAACVRRVRPEVVIHLAAQPLVRRAYREPAETFAVNVMGGVNLLEALRESPDTRVCVFVTTDKVYDELGEGGPYAEADPLGGREPYGASKACAEHVAAAWRASFLAPRGLSLSTARAGNVIGGGDWAEDRILPDCVRALAAGKPVPLRHPESVRPWQHVLEPLSGYLLLAARQLQDPSAYSEAWNFGPAGAQDLPVSGLADLAVQAWGSGSWTHAPDGGPREAPS